MPAEIRVPAMGESIAEATVGNWLKKEGDAVSRGEPVVELETEKANVEVSADADGVLEKIARKAGETVKPGDVLGMVGDAKGGRAAVPVRAPEAAPERERPRREESGPERGKAAREAEPARPERKRHAEAAEVPGPKQPKPAEAEETVATPVARRLAEERGVDLAELKGTGRGGKVTREDVEAFLGQEEAREAVPKEEAPERRERAPAEAARGAPERKREEPGEEAKAAEAARPPPRPTGPLEERPAEEREERPEEPREERVRLSRRRLTIARRLLEAQQSAVMTTTFNEIDMTHVMDLRKRRREAFKEQFGVDLGLMSFFVKATIGALKAYPRLNSQLDGDELVLKRHYDIGIAVASEEGLVVPVLRDADKKTFAEVEKAIGGMAQRTKDRKLTLDELQGGTFTITNGGVFGSLMSTPILNPPQVGILGMHRAMERPVAINGKVEIRPMMNVALTYDHRVVDGSDGVRFLVRVKELVEDPARLLLEG
ncbi:MAG: 2-oxoglutarate dehydrogenase complex dihydrolipoyllysine-residue succinyltransferase [Chloroflexi bacterium]|nr:2-oxoglutarate dehydrogenase complex dihydrolipoyllysine-residue succinyltransferase [Chloroflexota bacterium]